MILKCVVYRKLSEIPIFKKFLLFVLKEITYLEEKDTFQKMMKAVVFSFKKYKNSRSLLTERQDISVHPITYLKMLRNKEKGPKKPVLHANKTWVHTYYTVLECWQHDTLPSTR
jgi:hypothetical protein